MLGLALRDQPNCAPQSPRLPSTVPCLALLDVPRRGLLRLPCQHATGMPRLSFPRCACLSQPSHSHALRCLPRAFRALPKHSAACLPCPDLTSLGFTSQVRAKPAVPDKHSPGRASPRRACVALPNANPEQAVLACLASPPPFPDASCLPSNDWTCQHLVCRGLACHAIKHTPSPTPSLRCLPRRAGSDRAKHSRACPATTRPDFPGLARSIVSPCLPCLTSR